MQKSDSISKELRNKVQLVPLSKFKFTQFLFEITHLNYSNICQDIWHMYIPVRSIDCAIILFQSWALHSLNSTYVKWIKKWLASRSQK